jgi:hypothetical protein
MASQYTRFHPDCCTSSRNCITLHVSNTPQGVTPRLYYVSFHIINNASAASVSILKDISDI